jgi:hypothetical protein
MDEQIHQMVTEDIEAPKIVIEGQGEESEKSKGFLIGNLDRLVDAIPVNDFDLDDRILGDIGSVIELERNLKCIRISHPSHSNNQPNRDEMMKRKRAPFLSGSRGSRFFLILSGNTTSLRHVDSLPPVFSSSCSKCDSTPYP